MMRSNTVLRPGMHVLYDKDTENEKEYTIDSVSVLVNRSFEMVGQRFVSFHLTDHYDLGVKCMEIDDFRQAFEVKKDG